MDPSAADTKLSWMSFGAGHVSGSMCADFDAGDEISGSLIMFWLVFACTALELVVWEDRIVLSKLEDGDELIIEVLKLLLPASLPFARLAGSYSPVSLEANPLPCA